MKSDLNLHILDTIKSTIEEKVNPSIKNVIGGQNSTNSTNLDLRSEGPHPSNFSQVRTQTDFRSNVPHLEKASQVAQDAQKDFPRLVAMRSIRLNHSRETSVDSD